MRFKIDQSYKLDKTRLLYFPDEHSFNMLPYVPEVNFYLTVNFLNLTVDDEGRVVSVSGYCPINSDARMPLKVPSAIPGVLMAIGEFEPGFSYRCKEGLPVTATTDGWVCIGEVESVGTAVEFLDNCIAVLEADQLRSLWLKYDQ